MNLKSNAAANTDLAIAPHEIEMKSFEIITRELGDRQFPEDQASVIKRVIHTTADFSYAESLSFTENALWSGIQALQNNGTIITDTNMALAGINKGALTALGCKAICFMADEDVAQTARENGTTRAVASMEKAAQLKDPLIFAVGNAPTALIHLCELMDEGKLSPALIIGVPVGFVNVVESKEMIIGKNVESIVAKGRKGGSNVAAAICNALLYSLTRKEEN